MWCLSCEGHMLFRVVMRFTKEAIIAGLCTAPTNKLLEKYGSKSVHIAFENDNNRYPAIGIAIVDVEVPNMQRRTAYKIAKEIKSLIDGEMLEEGFIEICEPVEVLELLPMEEDMKACATAKNAKR